MARIRYYTDEHVARAIVRALQQRGVDVLSVPSADMRGASDDEHLGLAFAQERVIFTQDADFLRLAAAGHEHAGNVYAPQTRTIGEIVHGLMLIYQLLELEDMYGRIGYL